MYHTFRNHWGGLKTAKTAPFVHLKGVHLIRAMAGREKGGGNVAGGQEPPPACAHLRLRPTCHSS